MMTSTCYWMIRHVWIGRAFISCVNLSCHGLPLHPYWKWLNKNVTDCNNLLSSVEYLTSMQRTVTSKICLSNHKISLLAIKCVNWINRFQLCCWSQTGYRTVIVAPLWPIPQLELLNKLIVLCEMFPSIIWKKLHIKYNLKDSAITLAPSVPTSFNSSHVALASPIPYQHNVSILICIREL